MTETTEKMAGPKQNVLHKVPGLSDAEPLLKPDFSQYVSMLISWVLISEWDVCLVETVNYYV